MCMEATIPNGKHYSTLAGVTMVVFHRCIIILITHMYTYYGKCRVGYRKRYTISTYIYLGGGMYYICVYIGSVSLLVW